MNHRTPTVRHRAAAGIAAALAGVVLCGSGAVAGSDRTSLTVARPRSTAHTPVVPSPLLPGAPLPWSGSPVLTAPTLSIVDQNTRFLTAGPAQDRCPHQRVVFVPGVLNAFRPTLPGDGAFMCQGDAVAEGFIGP